MQQFAIPPFYLAGEAAALGAALVWAASLGTFRVHGAGIAPQILNTFKVGIAAGGLVLLVLLRQPDMPQPSLVWQLVVSGVIGISLGDTALFAALHRLGAQLTAVTQTLCPPFTALLAYFWLGEKLTPWELTGMALTITAVTGAILFRKSTVPLPRRTLGVGLLFAAVSAVANGTGIVIARQAFQTVDVGLGTLLRVGGALVLLIPWAHFFARGGWGPLVRTRRRLGWLALASFSGTFLGLLLMSMGTKYAKAGVATALNMTYPVWILPISILILHEPMDWRGGLCVVLAVVGVGLMFVL